MTAPIGDRPALPAAGAGADHWRPTAHLTAPDNWMNDPNGLIHHRGQYHAFYQLNPFAPLWARPFWGHATSPDLVTWTHRPIALRPDDPFDAEGCYSGCCLVVDGTPTIFYTAVSASDGGLREVVHRATSTDPDLVAWTKDPEPLIDAPPPGLDLVGFRDPFVWQAADGTWRMLLGAGNARRGGMLLLYASDDALRWRYRGVLLEAADLEPDRHPDVVGIVWECPVLVRLHETDVLVFSVMRDGPGPVVAVLGHLDGDRLVPRLVQRLDDGPSFYAPHPLRTPSGDVVLLGWLREREPRQSTAEGWSGAMSLPRRVRVEGGRLRVALDGAVEALRTATLPVLAGPRGPATSEWSVELTGGPVELALTGPVPPGRLEVQGVAADGSVFLRLTVGPGAATAVRHAGEASSTVLVDGEIGPGDPFEVRLCLDGSVLELSLGGTLTSSDRFYSAPMRGGRLQVHLEGSAGEVLVQAWSWAATGFPTDPVAADH